MKHKSYDYKLNAVDYLTEDKSFKTCGHCGTLNNVGSRDIFSSNKCNIIIDRDVNGERNIAIKRLKELGL